MKQNDQKSTSSEFKSKPDETKQINNSGGSRFNFYICKLVIKGMINNK